MRISHGSSCVAEKAQAIESPIKNYNTKQELLNRLISLQFQQQKNESEIRDFKAFLDANHTDAEKKIVKKHLGRMITDTNTNAHVISKILREVESIRE